MADFSPKSAAALLSALRLAYEHGGAEAALRAIGIELPEGDQFEGVADELENVIGGYATDARLREALALGFLTGRLAFRLRARARTSADPTSFVLDRDLVVQRAEGESILRLPWVEDDLFVGRRLPDISEVPAGIRALSIEHYLAALGGERRRFSFRSYGHAYWVDAVPVRDDYGGIKAVLAIATPALAAPARDAPVLTPREMEVVELASRGLTSAEIAEQLFVSAGTIKNHLHNIYAKLEVSDKAAAVAAALRHGLIE
jgi:DNA-binding CsgD family transcriptional regulator